mgnify:CR=1 FL=1
MDPIARAAKIKSDLFQAGYSLNAVDREFGLARQGSSRALREPYAAAEVAIAKVLNTEPHKLFTERYAANGERLTPQPRQNYDRPETMAERRAAGARA